VEQPKWTDDVQAWRRHAGELRQRLGAAKAHAAAETERADGEHARAEVWRGWFKSARAAGRRADRQLGHVEALLRDGEVDAAIRLLAERRERIGTRATL
jgi:hypothetical protein